MASLSVEFNIKTWDLSPVYFEADSLPLAGEEADCFLTVEVCVLCQQGALRPIIPAQFIFTAVHITRFLDYVSSYIFTQFLS